MKPPRIDAKRIVLRPLNLNDTSALFTLMSRADIGPLAGWKPHQSPKHTKAYIKDAKRFNKQTYVFGIVLKETSRLIGTVELYNIKHNAADTGLIIHPDVQGLGYGKETINAILHFSFEHLFLNKVYYRTFTENDPSIQLMKSLGFSVLTVQYRGYTLYDGSKKDLIVGMLTQQAYHENNALLTGDIRVQAGEI